ncbi:MAG: hypothetical protein AAF513_20895 [Pseudomonadota bacterium]
MSHTTRDRAKRHFPTVGLTLLSIVQALALELLWGYITEANYLYAWNSTALIGWLQVLTTLIGLGLVWVIYASNIMRFEWVPTMSDSIYPFVIGIAEFALVGASGPGRFHLWFIAITLIIAVTTWVVQITMVRARLEAENAEFFATRAPATLADFVPQISVCASMLLIALLVWLFPASLWLQALGTTCTLGFLLWQFRDTTRYWQASIAPNTSTEQADP